MHEHKHNRAAFAYPRITTRLPFVISVCLHADGGFIDACIIHGSTNSSIDGVTNLEAFQAWMEGTNTQQWYIMKCGGSETDGPCDTSPICAPYP